MLRKIQEKLNGIYESEDPNNGGLSHPLIELTYLGPNQRTWNNNDPEKGLKIVFLIPYFS